MKSLASLPVLAVSLACSDSSTSARAANTPLYVHDVDIPALVARVVDTRGLLDPQFVESISHADAFYTDFYGVQALARTSRDDILRDFVPAHATHDGSDEHSVRLLFDEGWGATFYPNAALRVQDSVVAVDHVFIEGADWREFTDHLASFRAILQRDGLEQKHLIANPFHDLELLVAARRAEPALPLPAEGAPYPTFSGAADAILIFPDPVHGDLANYERLLDLLSSLEYDWFALEMLSADLQGAADGFVSAPDGSAAYLDAERQLKDYYRTAWNRFGDEAGDPENNRYFQLLRRMRERGKRVIGLEQTPVEYTVFRYGETPFGGGVRSASWARAVPPRGKGVVFGGSAHFTSPQAINFQDFVLRDQPERELVAATVPEPSVAGELPEP